MPPCVVTLASPVGTDGQSHHDTPENFSDVNCLPTTTQSDETTLPSPTPHSYGAHHMPLEEFRRHAHSFVDYVVDYYATLDKRRVGTDVQPNFLVDALPQGPPRKGEAMEDILRDFDQLVLPGVLHWQHPQFLGYYPSNTSPPSYLADMLIQMITAVGFTWASCPAITELEFVALDWLAQALGMPDQFRYKASKGQGGGCIQGTVCEAIVVAVLSAIAQKETKLSVESLARADCVVYCTDQTHCSTQKSALIAGIPLQNIRKLPTTSEKGLRMQPDVLRAALEKDIAAGLVPVFIVTTLGTTSTCAFDRLEEVGAIGQEFDVWVHVDAAYAGSALVCEEYRYLSAGVEKCTSFSFNPHKWLLTGLDCSAYWTADIASMEKALTGLPAAYLRSKEKDEGLVRDMKDWQLPLSRRGRAIKLWFVMRSYGIEGMQAHIRSCVANAQRLYSALSSDYQRFDSVAIALSLVTFRVRGLDNDQQREYVEKVNAGGNAWIISTEVHGRVVLRASVGGWMTTLSHVDNIVTAFQTAADDVFSDLSASRQGTETNLATEALKQRLSEEQELKATEVPPMSPARPHC